MLVSILLMSLTIFAVSFLQPIYAANYVSYADTGAARLYSYYSASTGLWNGEWWNSANHLNTLIDYMTRGGSNNYSSIINNTYTLNINSGSGSFRTGAIDDTGWWGLAWLRAYDMTGNTTYLNTAQADADWMQSFWDTSSCNGGVWWSDAKTYKNAITVELYVKLSAAYYNRTKNSTYLTRAQTGWNWFMNSGMINSSNLVNDGLTLTCQNNGQPTWTYNQGVILGAAAELYRATGNSTYLSQAQPIANAAMTNLINTQTGALRENACESDGSCNSDSRIFKGIFMRNLYELNAVSPNQADQNFITLNADTIWA